MNTSSRTKLFEDLSTFSTRYNHRNTSNIVVTWCVGRLEGYVLGRTLETALYMLKRPGTTNVPRTINEVFHLYLESNDRLNECVSATSYSPSMPQLTKLVTTRFLPKHVTDTV